MKLTYRISLLVGLLVVAVAAAIGVPALLVASRMVREAAENALLSQAQSGADMVRFRLESRLELLQEMANRAGTRTMDFEIQRESLLPEIDRLGYLDLGILIPGGMGRTIKEGTQTDLSGRDYAKQALSGKRAVSDVLVSTVTNQPVIIYAVPITDDQGRVLGALYARDDAQSLSRLIEGIKFGKTGYSYITNLEGAVVAHPNPDKVLSKENSLILSQSIPALLSIAAAVRQALGEESGIVKYTYEGADKYMGHARIQGFAFMFYVAVDAGDLFAGVETLRLLILIIGVVSILVGLSLAFVTGRRIAGPIIRICDFLGTLGRGDLTARLELKAKAEIGDLVRYCNDSRENLSHLVGVIRQQSDELLHLGGSLSTNMNDIAAAGQEISTTIHHIGDQVRNQSSKVEKVNATMEQIKSGIDELHGHVEHQGEAVADSSSAVEEMIANIQSVTATVGKSVGSMEELADAADVGRAGLQEVSTNIQEIARESEGLLEINGVMENISSQTNLLSMNAAIEAAHAGESGKGFAVVAGEIRKLAESSSEQSKTIGAVLKKIKTSIDRMTVSNESVFKKFEAIDQGIKGVTAQVENIRSAMEEQNAGSRQILEAIGNVNSITRQVSEGAARMQAGSAEVIAGARDLEGVTAEITGGMEEMSSGAVQMNNALIRVQELTGKNKEDIGVLVQEVARFKVA